MPFSDGLFVLPIADEAFQIGIFFFFREIVLRRTDHDQTDDAVFVAEVHGLAQYGAAAPQAGNPHVVVT